MSSADFLGEIASAGLEKLWIIYSGDSNIDMDSQEFLMVRFGIDLKFDICDYISGIDCEILEKGWKYRYGHKVWDLADVNTEILKRVRLMRESLMSIYDINSVASLRRGKDE